MIDLFSLVLKEPILSSPVAVGVHSSELVSSFCSLLLHSNRTRNEQKHTQQLHDIYTDYSVQLLSQSIIDLCDVYGIGLE